MLHTSRHATICHLPTVQTKPTRSTACKALPIPTTTYVLLLLRQQPSKQVGVYYRLYRTSSLVFLDLAVLTTE